MSNFQNLGVKSVFSTPRTVASNFLVTPLMTLPATANVVERTWTAARPNTVTSGNSAGLVINPSLNFLRISPVISQVGAAYTLNVIGWSFSTEVNRWLPTPIVSQNIVSATTGGSFTYPIGTSPPTVVGALTIADPTNAGNRTRFPGFAQGSQFGCIVIDALACDLVELILHNTAGGSAGGALIAEF